VTEHQGPPISPDPPPEERHVPPASAAMGNPAVAASGSGQRAPDQTGSARSRGQSAFVYAVGRLAPQFPSLGVEKEFAQLTEGLGGGGLVEIELLRGVLDVPENRYLGRHLCWVFTTQHVEAFTVLPRDDADVTRLVEMISPDESEGVVHVVVGRFSPGAADSPCVASRLPTVIADQLLAFTLDEFAQALPDADTAADKEMLGEQQPTPPGGNGAPEQFQAVVREVFVRLTRRADNYGIADDHRAFNYIALRYPPIYHTVMQAYRQGKRLVSVDGRHSHSASRRLVAVRLTFRHRHTEIIERYHCVVDVTDLFPFLASPLTLVYD
jgi:hypothetical protein